MVAGEMTHLHVKFYIGRPNSRSFMQLQCNNLGFQISFFEIYYTKEMNLHSSNWIGIPKLTCIPVTDNKCNL